MPSTVSLEQVGELPPQEQLRLLAHISERSSQLPLTIQGTDEAHQRSEYVAQVEAWLAVRDEVAEQIQGEFDSADDLRQIREERT